MEFGGSSYLGAGEWCVSDFLVSIIVYVLFENNKLAYELKFKVIAIFLSNHIHQIDLSEMDHDFSAKCAKKPQKKPKMGFRGRIGFFRFFWGCRYHAELYKTSLTSFILSCT